MKRSSEVTLRKDCKCTCHAASNAVIHVQPCYRVAVRVRRDGHTIPFCLTKTRTKPSLFSVVTSRVKLVV